jgi:hypothetical protein
MAHASRVTPSLLDVSRKAGGIRRLRRTVSTFCFVAGHRNTSKEAGKKTERRI